MSSETIVIHLIWATFSSAFLYVVHKNVGKYANIKQLEAMACVSERFGAIFLQVLKESDSKFGIFPLIYGRPSSAHNTPAQTYENEYSSHETS